MRAAALRGIVVALTSAAFAAGVSAGVRPTFARPEQAAVSGLRQTKLRTTLIRVRRWPLLQADHLDPRLNRLYLLTYRVLEPAPPVIPKSGIYEGFAYVARPAVGARWHLVRFGTGP